MKIKILVVLLAIIMSSGCFQQVSVPSDINDTTIREGMIYACEKELCNVTIVENEYYIKALCSCLEGDVLTTYNKKTRVYQATEQ